MPEANCWQMAGSLALLTGTSKLRGIRQLPKNTLGDLLVLLKPSTSVSSPTSLSPVVRVNRSFSPSRGHMTKPDTKSTVRKTNLLLVDDHPGNLLSLEAVFSEGEYNL